ncbi:MAG: DNA topoisomerase (ATP-hydrolyzing) subunit B [Akkermansia sp.]|nr:DNA topoisomerase (ATP-hydrolyzing) subunit B [Akkermansia sp.]
MTENTTAPEDTETVVTTGAQQEYGAAQIDKLEGLEAVRKRPGMYIGDPDERGLHHCVFEVLDNSIDEHLAGYCTKIIIQIHEGGTISVIDNGRGIPVDMHPKFGIPAVELVLTNLHAGGKFGQGAYKYSGGLHGVGAKCVNALSDFFKAEVRRDGKRHVITFERGKTTEKLHVVGTCPEGQTGTAITFLPDPTIFTDTTEFKFDLLGRRLRELAFLNPGLVIELTDERSGQERTETFYYKDGIREFVKQLGENKTLITQEPIAMSGVRHIEVEYDGKTMEDDVIVDVVMQYNDSDRYQIQCYANSIFNADGGTHLSGFRSSLTRAINNYAKTNNLLKDKDPSLNGDDVREGLVAVISVKMPNPRFSSQTKDKLVNTEIEGVVSSVVYEELKEFFEENPQVARTIIDRCLIASRAREAARKARESVRKSAMTVGGGLPGKLADCSNRDPQKCELFIVEGDSAGGSAKTARDRRTQAILPLRGKILNVEKARLDKALGSETIQNIITAIGAGIGDGEGEGSFDLSKVRYHKIILMADADVDGAHICTLLLTLFCRHMPQLVRAGYLYIAQPPLYRVIHRKVEQYVQDEVSLNRKLISLGAGDVVLRTPDQSMEFDADSLMGVLETLISLQKYEGSVAGHGGDFRDLLRHRAATGNFPQYLVKVRCGNDEEVQYFGDMDSLTAFSDENRDLFLFGEPTEEELAANPLPVREGPSRRALLHELHEAKAITRVLARLEELGIATDSLLSDGEPVFELVEKSRNTVTPINYVPDILTRVLEIGGRSVTITRFKGLGEMNAKDLYDTTMDPEKRELLRVRLDDDNAVQADKMFSILMGDLVEPRRRFIEDNALNVRNLDV